MATEKIPVVILCGGQGTRMRGQTLTKKELVHVGGRPIIWHVMRIFSAHDYNSFLLTLGFQADQIKRYFLEYEAHSRDLTVIIGGQEGKPNVMVHNNIGHPRWDVSLIDTGLHTEKGSRIARVAPHLIGDRFFVAYGDDVSDIDLTKLVEFHRTHGKLATLTGVRIHLPYGVVQADEDGIVHGFVERPLMSHWINGGFMLFEREVLDLISDGDNVSLETDILPALASDAQLVIFRHHGFWQSMNTMKDNILLEDLWREGAPWKVW
ncbi:MAG: glucose-1-phosphate cytidylyltransferase [Anaerolineae bacterium]|nr:MAG: glucose-1-phosphate cytidylyltransferase [Anaerolineae bacterium]